MKHEKWKLPIVVMIDKKDLEKIEKKRRKIPRSEYLRNIIKEAIGG